MRIWLFLLVFLLACAPPRFPTDRSGYTDHPKESGRNTLLIPTWVDGKFHGELKTAVLDAVDEWNVVFNGKFRFEIQDDDTDREKRQGRGEISLWVRLRSADDIPVAGVLGWWDPDSPLEVNLVGDLLNVPPRGMRTVLEHEIGHYLGLDHIRVKGTLMYPAWTDQGHCIDRVTVTVLASEHGWDDTYLNWCVQ